MYKTCIYCNKPLESNEAVEHFPVGRRLAFDPAKGRLWVVCRKCKRWNLTPLEERWEAIEECERFYRGTNLRASTGNIGIAKHPEGLELVRIGKPLRPEFAAWRYGDQMGDRRRKQVVATAVGAPLGVALYEVIAPLAGLAMVPIVLGSVFWIHRRTVAKVRVGDASAGAVVTPENIARFRYGDLETIKVLPDHSEPRFQVEICRGRRTASFTGQDAGRVAAAIMPLINEWGATRAKVAGAVAAIESHRHPTGFLSAVAREGYTDWQGRVGYVKSMPKPTKLALEMALHEEQERRALEGELWVLEQAWKEAEEIAAIADSLLLPAGTDAFFARHARADD